MRTVVEFGERGANHAHHICRTEREGLALANALCHVLGMGDTVLKLARNNPRSAVTSSSHFVSISKLDGTERGPAAAKLWHKPKVATSWESV